MKHIRIYWKTNNIIYINKEDNTLLESKYFCKLKRKDKDNYKTYSLSLNYTDYIKINGDIELINSGVEDFSLDRYLNSNYLKCYWIISRFTKNNKLTHCSDHIYTTKNVFPSEIKKCFELKTQNTEYLSSIQKI